MPARDLKSRYTGLQIAAAADLGSPQTREAIQQLAQWSYDFLTAKAQKEPLQSKVPDKSYFMFSRIIDTRTKRSRPINSSLFMDGPNSPFDLDQFVNPVKARPPREVLQRAIYTLCASYFAASDLLNEGDQKTPGTFFEFFVGHVFASLLGVNPSRFTTTQTIDGPLTIPTDYIFELGAGQPRVHLPIKTSTRERAVQVWAHQRLLDGMHGDGRFRGILVCFAETNKQDNRFVVEVCVPNQWLAYQRFIARLHRIYYLDPPIKYLALREVYPPLPVYALSDMFDEINSIVRA